MTTIDLVDQGVVRRRERSEAEKKLEYASRLAARYQELDGKLRLPDTRGADFCEVQEERDGVLRKLLAVLA